MLIRIGRGQGRDLQGKSFFVTQLESLYPPPEDELLCANGRVGTVGRRLHRIMEDRAAHSTDLPPRSNNQNRKQPLLPGTSMPAPGPLPLACIYQPAPSSTQSGRGRGGWVLEFAPSSPPEIEPLMGWVGSRDPFAHIRLRFPDRQSAIEFAERQGWPHAVQNPPARRFRLKSYADNFRYDLADAIARAERPWDGHMSITDRRETGDDAPGAEPRGAAHAAARSPGCTGTDGRGGISRRRIPAGTTSAA